MKKWLVAVGLVVVGMAKPNRSEAQTNWNHGQLVLNNSVILEGDLNYNWMADVLQVKQDNVTRAFSAQKIGAFTFYDRQNNTLRRFVTIDYAAKPTLNRTIVVEELATGPCMIYRRMRRHRDLVRLGNQSLLINESTNTKNVDDFDYFIQINNELVRLDDFRRKAMPMMLEEFKGELDDYVHSHQLDANSTTTQLMLLIRYNTLKEEQIKAAPIAHWNDLGDKTE